MSELDTAALQVGLKRIVAKLEASADELNTADAKLGDGDLGVTMQRGARSLAEIVDELPEDVGMALMKCAQAFTKTSGSSYGTLLATGLMSAAKSCKGHSQIPWSEISNLLEGAIEAMIQRGKGQLGQKTVLDTLDAVRIATQGLDHPPALLGAANDAVQASLDAFREKPSQQGRARIFAAKSVGLDDPGMLAFEAIVTGLRGDP